MMPSATSTTTDLVSTMPRKVIAVGKVLGRIRLKAMTSTIRMMSSAWWLRRWTSGPRRVVMLGLVAVT